VTVRVGVIGTGAIGTDHATRLASAVFGSTVSVVTDIDRARAEQVAAAIGGARVAADGFELIRSDDVDGVLIATVGETHAAFTLACIEAGKPVLCEKPLGIDANESRAMLEAAEEAQVAHACGFNYRYVPAVALAHELIASGRLGALRHYRAVYLQDYQLLAQQPRTSGGAGAVLDYSHIVDMLRFLAAEPEALIARTAHFVSEREDAYAAVLELPDGALGSLEASRCALGWKGRQVIEINGSDGSLWWDMEDLNRLHVFLADDESEGLGGFRDVLVTRPDHPYLAEWWPPGHVLGWDATFVHQWRDFLEAVIEDRPVPDRQASFRDGLRAAVVCEAILTAAEEGRRIEIESVAAGNAVGS
jgi:predicted dehydrogenase